MKLLDFYDLVEAHADLEGVGIETYGRPAIMVRNVKTGSFFRIPIEEKEIAKSDFYDWVKDRLDLEGVGIVITGKPAVVVRNVKTESFFRIPVGEIAKGDWENIGAILEGRHKDEALYRMLWMVGYFSWIENWNKSKLGELRDSHRDDCGVEAMER
jgi:hypothetical protein